MTNSFVSAVDGANSWVGKERELLTGETPGQQVWNEIVDKLWPFTEQNLAPIAEQLEIYKNNPQQFSLDWSPMVRNSETNKWEWNKTGLKRLGGLVLFGTILGSTIAACNVILDNNGGGGNGVNPDNGDKDNCSWLTTATIGIVGNMNDAASFIGVDSASFANMSQLQADVQCFIPKAVVNEVFTDGVNSIVNIIAPDDLNEGNLRPVWGVVSGDVTDGSNQGKLLKLINVSNRDGITVFRDSENEILKVGLDSAVVSVDQKLGDGDIASAQLEVGENESGEVIEILLKVGDKSISMTPDQVGQLVGGGFVLGAVDAFLTQQNDLRVNSTREGVNPDLSSATGVIPNLEGAAGESLSLTGELQAAINSQGFIPVLCGGNLLNFHLEGKIGVCTTEVVADRNNPAITYNLVQLENGQWTPVHPGLPPLTNENGLVVFGDSQGIPVEQMIAVVPNMFGNLEAVTLIVKDPTRIPDPLKASGYEFLNATVFTALIDPKTGEIKSLVPAIHEGEIKMSQNGQGKLAITVINNSNTDTYELAASNVAFMPDLPENILAWTTAHTDFNWQKQGDGYGLIYKSATGEVLQIPIQFEGNGTVRFTIDNQELSGQVQIKDNDNLLINVADGRSFTFQNGVLEGVYTGIGGEAFITDSEVQSLADTINCESARAVSNESCFKDISDSYGESYFRFVSTGEVEEIVVKDPDSGRDVLMSFLYVVSKNGNSEDNGFIVPFFTQAVFVGEAESLGYDAGLLSLYGPTGVYPSNPKNIVSINGLQEMAPKGSKYQIAFPKIRPPAGEGLSATWIVKYLFSQPSYAQSLSDFSNSNGSIVGKDLIIIATRWNNFSFW